MRPTTGKAFVHIDEGEQTYSGTNLIRPDSEVDAYDRGQVIAIGAPATDDYGNQVKPEFKVGEDVIFNSFKGDTFVMDDMKVAIIEQKEIIAVIE